LSRFFYFFNVFLIFGEPFFIYDAVSHVPGLIYVVMLSSETICHLIRDQNVTDRETDGITMAIPRYAL